MKFTLTLATGMPIFDGVDEQALVEDIEAEIQNLARTASTTPRRKNVPPPAGAQGSHELIQWVVDVVADPEKAKLYAQILIFALNKILLARLPDDTKDGKAADPGKEEDKKKPLQLKLPDKQLLLPATAEAIRLFLESLKDGS